MFEDLESLREEQEKMYEEIRETMKRDYVAKSDPMYVTTRESVEAIVEARLRCQSFFSLVGTTLCNLITFLVNFSVPHVLAVVVRPP